LSQFVTRGVTRLPGANAATGAALGAIHFSDLLAVPAATPASPPPAVSSSSTSGRSTSTPT
jgi:hypothetical protein